MDHDYMGHDPLHHTSSQRSQTKCKHTQHTSSLMHTRMYARASVAQEPSGSSSVAEGRYSLSASGNDWSSMFKALVLKPDGKATYREQDVADRDTHEEDHYEGRYQVEGAVLVFYGDKVKSDHCYNYAKEFTECEFSQRFKILPDGNLNEMDKEGGLIMNYRFGTRMHARARARAHARAHAQDTATKPTSMCWRSNSEW